MGSIVIKNKPFLVIFMNDMCVFFFDPFFWVQFVLIPFYYNKRIIIQCGFFIYHFPRIIYGICDFL